MNKHRITMMVVSVLILGVALFGFTVHAQWQEPQQSPPQGLPPGFVWLQGASPTAQVGNISLNGSATFGPVAFSGDAQGVQVTASATALRLYSNRDIVIRLNTDDASDGLDAPGTFLIENGVGNLVYQIGENGTSEQRSAPDPVTGQPQFFSTLFDGTQQVLYQANSNYFTFNPLVANPMDAGVYVYGGRVHIATDATSGALSSSGDLVLYAGDATGLREGLRVKGDTGNVQVSTLCLSGVCNSTWPAAGGGGSVTSVGLSMPSPIFAVSGSPVTGSGTLTAMWNNQNPNLVLAGPASGAAATPTFRNLVAADIPIINVTTGTSDTLGATRGGTGVISVAVGDILYGTAPSGGNWSNLPGNTTTTKQFLSQSGNGITALAPAWNTLTAGDIPVLDAAKITSGTFLDPQIPNTIADATTFTAAPAGSGILQGPLMVNPLAADVVANETLFGIAVGGIARLRVDNDGDIHYSGPGGDFGLVSNTNIVMRLDEDNNGVSPHTIAVKDGTGTDRFAVAENGTVLITSDVSSVIFRVRNAANSTKFSVDGAGNAEISGSAIVGWERITASCPLAAGLVGSCHADCSTTTKRLLGGGCDMGSTSSSVMMRNAPISDTSWGCTMDNNSTTNGITITAHAMCARLAP